MKKNITYLLGAGASAQAMPTVAELPLALEVMSKYFGHLYEVSKPNALNLISRESDYRKEYDFIQELKPNSKKLHRIFKTIEALKTLVKSHASIDTLFRKINISERRYVEVQILKEKEIFYCDELLNIYDLLLLFCEYTNLNNVKIFKDDDKYITVEDGTKQENPAWKYFKSKNELDLRYDAFLATILEKEKFVKLPPNIKIISWNYDLQLERSIIGFTTQFEWQTAINTLEICTSNNNSLKYSTFKLNGSSFSYSNFDVDFYIKYGNLYTNGFQYGFILPFINSIEYDSDFHINKYNINHNLYFHWDDNSEVREKCFESIKDTEILVVIGYTFPTFNRETDRKLYNSMPKLEKVYIQAPTQYINDIKISFQSLLLEEENFENDEVFTKMNPTNTERYKGRLPYRVDPSRDRWYFMRVVGIDNINQFFIPPEF